MADIYVKAFLALGVSCLLMELHTNNCLYNKKNLDRGFRMKSDSIIDNRERRSGGRKN